MTYQVKLPEPLEEAAKQRMAAGQFSSVEEVLLDVILQGLRQEPDMSFPASAGLTVEQVRADIERSVREMDEGKFVDGETFFKELFERGRKLECGQP